MSSEGRDISGMGTVPDEEIRQVENREREGFLKKRRFLRDEERFGKDLGRN